MTNRFAPIPCAIPDTRSRSMMVCASILEPARVQPCYEGMDDMGDYAQAVGRGALENAPSGAHSGAAA